MERLHGGYVSDVWRVGDAGDVAAIIDWDIAAPGHVRDAARWLEDNRSVVDGALA